MGKCHDCLSVNKSRGIDYRQKLWNCHSKRLLRASENPWNAESQETEEGLVTPSAPSNCAGLQLLTEMAALCCQGTSFKVKALIVNCITMKTFPVNTKFLFAENTLLSNTVTLCLHSRCYILHIIIRLWSQF